MAQKRIRNYKHPILSFEHNVFNLGLHSSGRYMGFDRVIKLAGLQFYLAHTESNMSYITPIEETVGPIGVYLTPQGTIIQETENVGPFTIDSNAGNQFYRYDLIYATHNQIELDGGQPATYTLLKGPMGNSSKPALPNVGKTVIIGYMEIPPNEAGDINNCKWIKQRCPDSGDGADARLKEVNMFSKLQGDNLSAKVLLLPTINFEFSGIPGNLWELNNDGNTFKILPALNGPSYYLDGISIKDIILQDGIRIKILINEKVKVRRVGVIEQYANNGYRSFNYPNTFDTAYNPVANEMSPGPGVIWELDMVYESEMWRISDIGGRFAPKVVAPIDGLFAANQTKIIPGSFWDRPNEIGIYTAPTAGKYPILYKGSFHVGNLQDPGIDYAITFYDNNGTIIHLMDPETNLSLQDYTVLGTLESATANHNDGGTGVWTIIRGSKTPEGFLLHVNEYAHNINQDLYFEFLIIKNY